MDKGGGGGGGKDNVGAEERLPKSCICTAICMR